MYSNGRGSNEFDKLNKKGLDGGLWVILKHIQFMDTALSGIILWSVCCPLRSKRIKLKYCHSEHFSKKNTLRKLHLQNKHIESIMNTAQKRLESGAYHDKDLKGFVKGRPKVKF